MTSETKTNKLLLLPLLTAVAVGLYLIWQTCLITKDGPLYIERAKNLLIAPREVIAGPEIAYPAMILAAHKIVSFFGFADSPYVWTIPTQVMTLCCMLASLILIYLLGKNIVGRQDAFMAIVILVFLPYPMRFAVDIVREWPSMMMFMAAMTVFWAGAKKNSSVLFALAGGLTGIAYLVRAENAQVIIYALIWLSVCFFTKRVEMSRKKTVLTAAALLACFAVVAVPYMVVKGQLLPEKLQELMSNQDALNIADSLNYAGISCGKLGRAFTKIIERVAENLMYYFFVFFVVGVYVRIKQREEISEIEKIIVPTFFAINITMMVLLYYNHGYMSRRHCLAMSIVGLLYVPAGLRMVAMKLEEKFGRKEKDPAGRFWLVVLLIVGIGICLPKLLQPKRVDRVGFLNAARWLNANTPEDAIIAVPDFRVSFYAGRAGLEGWDIKDITQQAGYWVRVVKAGEPVEAWGVKIAEFPLDGKSAEKMVIVFKR